MSGKGQETDIPNFARHIDPTYCRGASKLLGGIPGSRVGISEQLARVPVINDEARFRCR